MCRPRIARLATTATVCGSPKETSNVSTRKFSARRPMTDSGSSGSSADSATDSANGMFFSNSCWTSASSSGKLKPLRQSSAFHSSVGFDSDAASQVDISGVKPSVPYRSVMWVSVSPFVV
jgi:hypothetical protein